MAAKSLIISAIAAIGLDVVGINDEAVYGPSGAVTGVKEVPEDIGVALPAFLMLPGEGEVIPGSWERQTWTLDGTIWTSYEPRGENVRLLTDFQELVLAAFRAKSKGFLAAHGDSGVQSALFTGFRPIEGRQWQRRESAPWYLVLPFSIEVKVNRAVTYQSA
jgi:hypothetical protein